MSSIKIRNYRPATDHREVIEICKDVYGGFDALPKVINSYTTEPDTYIYVCAFEDEDTLQSLICCQLRGNVKYIWGARTRDAYQGKGMAKLLLRHVEAEAARLYSFTSITGFLSTTITQNTPMRRIFNTHGYEEHCLVDIVSLTPENIKHFKEKTSVAADGLSAMTLQPCSSVSDLQLALHALRHNRNSSLESNSTISGTVPEWLPGEYIPWPIECDQVGLFLKEKKVFILSSSGTNTVSITNSNIPTVQAVIFVGMGDHGSPYAGIVAASWSSLVAAINHALELDGEINRLYIDRCEALDRGYLENVFKEGDLKDYIVVYKPFSK